MSHSYPFPPGYVPPHITTSEMQMIDDYVAPNRVHRPTPTGAFVVVEGPDGVGKTRTTQRIAELLRETGFLVIATREPSDGAIGRDIRAILRGDSQPLDAMTMSRMYAEDRLDHLKRIVLPAITERRVIVCDRYLLSSIAYQHGAMGLPLSDVLRFNRYAVVPDLTLVLRAPQDVCTSRRGTRGEAVSMFEDEETQRKIRRVYDNAFDYIELHNPAFIDASDEFDSVVKTCMRRVMRTIEEVSK